VYGVVGHSSIANKTVFWQQRHNGGASSGCTAMRCTPSMLEPQVVYPLPAQCWLYDELKPHTSLYAPEAAEVALQAG
jgi:hypothetical protein